ncbi:hypothetical protein DL95DRAFT_388820 [Leptodontidium sp. 2 PMI_412]|nr:hypothetical protein DL95DRAFT_388820 [Leptodontidium sp. 2 PMI_412]
MRVGRCHPFHTSNLRRGIAGWCHAIHPVSTQHNKQSNQTISPTAQPPSVYNHPSSQTSSSHHRHYPDTSS